MQGGPSAASVYTAGNIGRGGRLERVPLRQHLELAGPVSDGGGRGDEHLGVRGLSVDGSLCQQPLGFAHRGEQCQGGGGLRREEIGSAQLFWLVGYGDGEVSEDVPGLSLELGRGGLHAGTARLQEEYGHEALAADAFGGDDASAPFPDEELLDVWPAGVVERVGQPFSPFFVGGGLFDGEQGRNDRKVPLGVVEAVVGGIELHGLVEASGFVLLDPKAVVLPGVPGPPGEIRDHAGRNQLRRVRGVRVGSFRRGCSGRKYRKLRRQGLDSYGRRKGLSSELLIRKAARGVEVPTS